MRWHELTVMQVRISSMSRTMSSDERHRSDLEEICYDAALFSWSSVISVSVAVLGSIVTLL